MPNARAGRAIGPPLGVGLLVVLLLSPWDAHSSMEDPGGACPSGSPTIVSFAPGVTSSLVRLGLTGCVVGRAGDDSTPEVQHLPIVGTVLQPDRERLRAVEPDLIFTWRAQVPPPLATLSAVTGVRVEVVRMDRLDDIEPALLSLGALTGRSDTAVALTRAIRSELGRIEVIDTDRPRVVWAVGRQPQVVAGQGSLPDDLLRVVGAHNVFTDGYGPWPRPSAEALAARPIDVLIWPVGGDLPPFDELHDEDPWSRYAARHSPRVVELDADLVHEAGPRVAEAAAELSRLLR